MKKVLITGITGFAGSHLAELLVADKEYEIVGVHASDRNLPNIKAIEQDIRLQKLNLLDREAITRFVGETKPEVIYHLAATATVKESFEKAADFINNNATSQINLFEAVREHNLSDTKIIVASSAQIYGLVAPKDIPIDETVPFTPDNPYSVSKITQDYLAQCYFLAYNMPIIRVRPFNHIGPRLSPEISISRFAKLIAEIERGEKEPVLHVGNLEGKRDFTDVRDMMRAYIIASEKCKAGEAYNIGTGVSHTIGDVLNQLIGMAKVEIDVQSEESLFRPSDIPELRADSSKFTEATGWKPTISLAQTLQDILDYWRNIR